MQRSREEALSALQEYLSEPRWIVTIKLPRNPDHDPQNKSAGACPAHGDVCTDTTGQHHRFLVTTRNLWKLDTIEDLHITRIERAVTLRATDLASISTVALDMIRDTFATGDTV